MAIHLLQLFTYWAISGINEYNKPRFSAPATAYGQIQWQEVLTIDDHDSDKIQESVIYTKADIPLGSFIYNGEDTGGEPHPAARVVSRRQKVTNITNISNIWKLWVEAPSIRTRT